MSMPVILTYRGDVSRFVIDAGTALRIVTEGVVVAPGHELLAPTLWRSQVLATLHEAVARGELPADVALARLDAVGRLPVRLLGDAVLRRNAWKVADALGHASTYDAEYVALGMDIVGLQRAYILRIGLLPLREKLALWSLQEEHLPYYRKKDLREALAILDLLKPFRLPEPVQWHLMRIPFDAEHPDLAAQFLQYVRLRFEEGASQLPRPVNPCRELSDWELYYRQTDLYYAFSRAMEMPMEEDWLREIRIKICKEIQRYIT